ncbi:MAG: DUF4093 domain-containing protein [Clostridia bacterium]|nr:DUF4093 domain-containing protein [Clostridia bacterium]
MEKLKIPYPVIVEGKYDRQRLIEIIDANIYTTGGFGVFRHGEVLALLRRLSEKSPVIVLTDSDGAGTLIRSRITSAIPKDRLIQLYTPQIKGKEKRKTEPSKAGFLGVEGIDFDVLRKLFEPYADSDAAERKMTENPLTKADFYEFGLSGKPESAAKRDALAQRLGLPTGMTPNALLEAVKILVSYEEFVETVSKLK